MEVFMENKLFHSRQAVNNYRTLSHTREKGCSGKINYNSASFHENNQDADFIQNKIHRVL